MKNEFTNYVRSLGIGDALLSQIDALYDQCQQLVPEPFEEIAVSEIVQADGSKIYDLLYFFSNAFVCEIQSFVANPVIWLAPLHKGPEYVKFEKIDFDLKEAKPTSRFSIEARWALGFGIQPKAYGDNCIHLLELAKKYIVPHLPQ